MYAPITGIGFVTNASHSPAEYKTIVRTENDSDEADLWRDKLFAKRSVRYLCYTRKPLKQNGTQSDILTGLLLLNEDERAPSDTFSPISTTMDTNERALKRKTLYAQFLPKPNVAMAITHLIVCGRGRRPGANCTLLGELHNLTIWYKVLPIEECEPLSDARPASTNPSALRIPPRPPLPKVESDSDVRQRSMAFATTKRGNVHPLNGVPFELSKKYCPNGAGESSTIFDTFQCKTMANLNDQYNYNFMMEHSLLSGLST